MRMWEMMRGLRRGVPLREVPECQCAWVVCGEGGGPAGSVVFGCGWEVLLLAGVVQETMNMV